MPDFIVTSASRRRTRNNNFRPPEIGPFRKALREGQTILVPYEESRRKTARLLNQYYGTMKKDGLRFKMRWDQDGIVCWAEPA